MSIRGLPPTRRTVLLLCFRGDKHDILPQTVYESKCQGQLAGLDSKPYPRGRGETRLRSTSSSL